MAKKEKKGKKGARKCAQAGATTKRAIEAVSLRENGFPGDAPPEEVQVLTVREYAVNVGVAKSPDLTQTKIVLFGRPHPNSDVKTAWLVFHEDKRKRKPEYHPEEKRILVHYPMAGFAPIEGMLRGPGQVWCHYRQYEGDHRWADVHTGRIKLGGRKK